jgi:hypothetical protein
MHFALKQARSASYNLPQLLLHPNQFAVVRQPNDVVRRRGVQLGEQVVAVTFAVHDVNDMSCSADSLLARPCGASPAQRFAPRVGTHPTAVLIAAHGSSARPSLGPKHAEELARGRYRKACVQQEALCTACTASLVDSPQPFTGRR